MFILILINAIIVTVTAVWQFRLLYYGVWWWWWWWCRQR